MTGETVQTRGIAISIRPMSRTSHVVTWLTPGAGAVPMAVKGAVRPKSAYLGQYDLFYTCGIVYYARPHGGLWLPREIWPEERRDGLRGRWRETSLAAYAADLAGELAPPGDGAADWFRLLSGFLDSLAERPAAMSPHESLLAMLRFERGALKLAGLAPDLRHAAADGGWTSVAIDGGPPERGRRVARIPAGAAAAIAGTARDPSPADVRDAIRFFGAFIAYHLERRPSARESLVALLSSRPAHAPRAPSGAEC